MIPFLTRRSFLSLTLIGIPGLSHVRRLQTCHRPARAHSHHGPHPTPRPGIDASKVLKENDIKGTAGAGAAFNEVRQIPQIVDGIRCYCGCADLEGYYSLLTCYEGTQAMAQQCDLCQGHGRYVFRLHKTGKTLDEIRQAIDDRYGS